MPRKGRCLPIFAPPLGRIPFGPLRGRRGDLTRSLLAFPLLPCVQREGGTVRAGKLSTALSRDTFQTHWVRIQFRDVGLTSVTPLVMFSWRVAMEYGNDKHLKQHGKIMGNILTKIIYHENPILFKDISCFYKHAHKGPEVKLRQWRKKQYFKFEKRQTQNLI